MESNIPSRVNAHRTWMLILVVVSTQACRHSPSSPGNDWIAVGTPRAQVEKIWGIPDSSYSDRFGGINFVYSYTQLFGVPWRCTGMFDYTSKVSSLTLRCAVTTSPEDSMRIVSALSNQLGQPTRSYPGERWSIWWENPASFTDLSFDGAALCIHSFVEPPPPDSTDNPRF